jgi:hypothetical protein
MSKYRLDSRSLSQFKRHIRECSILEHKLMVDYVKWLNGKNKGLYTFRDNGVDNSGNFIENESQVSSEADFLLLKNDKNPKKIEIKHCKPLRDCFHLKINHIDKCIKDDICIINWMGLDLSNPSFCILTPKILQEYKDKSPISIFWSKKCIKFLCTDFNWIYPNESI